MPSNDAHLEQDQGVLHDPLGVLEEEDDEAAMDDLEKAARALGIDAERMTEMDGLPTELG